MSADVAEQAPPTPKPTLPVNRLVWIAFGLSVITAAGLWLVVAAALTGDFGDNTSLYWPQPWAAIVVGVTLAAPALVILSVVLDIIAGFRRGASRALALVGGLLLVTSPLFIVISLFR